MSRLFPKVKWLDHSADDVAEQQGLTFTTRKGAPSVFLSKTETLQRSI